MKKQKVQYTPNPTAKDYLLALAKYPFFLRQLNPLRRICHPVVAFLICVN